MSVVQGVRFALRLFRRTPFQTSVALLSIALCVGATAVVFTAIKSVLIDPLPYRHPDELVQLRTEITNSEPSRGDKVFRNDAQEIVRRTTTLESVAYMATPSTILPATPPRRRKHSTACASQQMCFPLWALRQCWGEIFFLTKTNPGMPMK
jgi:hypothetical protein